MLGSKVTAGTTPKAERGRPEGGGDTFYTAKLKSSYPNLIVSSESVSGEEPLLIPLPPLALRPGKGQCS